MSDDQKNVLIHIFDNVCKKKQILCMMHGGGGVGKSHVIKILHDKLKNIGKKIICTCPTGNGATLLIRGQTFHSAFKIYPNSKTKFSIKTVENMKKYFTDDILIIVVGEVLMLSSEYFALMDKRLRLIYKHSEPFGGKSILLSGDFMQMKCIGGKYLCSSMYNAQTSDQIMARNLFSQFTIFNMTHQIRTKCKKQKDCLDDFRILPNNYPKGTQ